MSDQENNNLAGNLENLQFSRGIERSMTMASGRGRTATLTQKPEDEDMAYHEIQENLDEYKEQLEEYIQQDNSTNKMQHY